MKLDIADSMMGHHLKEGNVNMPVQTHKELPTLFTWNQTGTALELPSYPSLSYVECTRQTGCGWVGSGSKYPGRNGLASVGWTAAPTRPSRPVFQNEDCTDVAGVRIAWWG